MEITSVNNELVKEAAKLQQKKYRNQSGKFLLEGFKSIKEAFDFGIELEYVFVRKEKKQDYKFQNIEIIEASEPVLKKISTTESCPEAVAIGRQKIYNPKSLNNMRKVILLENIKDAGNLGTIIRSSVAFGADAIVLYGQSVDLYNPKTVRSSVGNLWKLPIVTIEKYEDLENIFNKFERVATLPHSKTYLKKYSPKFPILLMFGSEADGLSSQLIDFSTNSIKIEMADAVESLNLAASVSVISYTIFVGKMS